MPPAVRLKNSQGLTFPMHEDSINLQFEVDKKDIAYLTGIIEGYDHFAVLRTLDQNRGIIELLISPDFLDDTLQLVEALKKEIFIRQSRQG